MSARSRYHQYSVIAAVSFMACGESDHGALTQPDATLIDEAGTEGGGLDAPGTATSDAGSDVAAGDASDASTDASTDAGPPYDPAGNCEPLGLDALCAPGDAGCVCEWSETMLADGVQDPTYGGFAAVSDALGGVFVLFSSSRDSLLHAMRHDPSSGAWTELSDVPQLATYQVAADGCGRVMVIGLEPSALTTLVHSSFVYDVRSGSWSTAQAPSMYGYVHEIEMSPRGHAVTTFQNAQSASASVLDVQTGVWAPGVELSPAFLRAAAIDMVGNFAAGIDTASRFTAAGLFIQWYEAQTGTWSDALEITTPGSSTPYPVFDARGALHVIWSAPSPSASSAIWTARVDRQARALVGAEELASVGQAVALQAAGVPQGNAAAVWARQSIAPGEYCYATPDGCEVVASAFDGATETWSAPQVLVTSVSPSLAVAASRTGNAVTAWIDFPRQADAGVSPSEPGVHASYFIRDVGWDAPTPMMSSMQAEVDADSLRAVMNGRGDAFVFWTQLGSNTATADSYELWSARRSCLSSP